MERPRAPANIRSVHQDPTAARFSRRDVVRWAARGIGVSVSVLVVNGLNNGMALAPEKVAGPLTTSRDFIDFIEQWKKITVERLVSSFKLNAITEERGRTWTIGELIKVEAAFARLRSEDIGVLDGLDLIRTDEIVIANSGAGKFTGVFSQEMKVAEDGKPASRSASIRLADAAFANDRAPFTGGMDGARPGSMQTILHEVGHAVESKARRDATFADLDATANFNEAIRVVNAAAEQFDRESRLAYARADAYTPRERTAMATYRTAFNDVIIALNAFGKTTVSESATLQTASQQAISERDSRRAALQTSSPAHPALTDFARADTRQNEWFEAAKDRVAPQAEFERARGARAQAEVTLPDGSRRSRRLQNFVDFVNLHEIDPVTEYAQRSWPDEPEEFFAEAFTLWLNDPSDLKSTAPLVFDWFEEGKHRE